MLQSVQFQKIDDECLSKQSGEKIPVVDLFLGALIFSKDLNKPGLM